MVRILHQITNIIEPCMNERLETLVGIYAAAVKVYIGLNDIVHALTMHSAGAVRLPYIACRRRLHFRNNSQPGYSCRPAA